MVIALIAGDTKKELMMQFCSSHCAVLNEHKLCATSRTGRYISDTIGLTIEQFMNGEYGGKQQICSRISCDEIDMLIFFGNSDPVSADYEVDNNLLRLCNIHNIPVATNVATAEILISALERGELNRHGDNNRLSYYSSSVKRISKQK